MRATNPFRASQIRPGVIPYLFKDGPTLRQLVERFETLGRYAEIVGPHGTGKSTLVESLSRAWNAQGINVINVRLHNMQRSLTPTQRHSIDCQEGYRIVILDGAEQLRFWRRWLWYFRCRRNGWGLLLTTHKSLGANLLWETASHPELASAVVETLIDTEQLGTVIDADIVRELLCQNNGDIRETLFALYDWWREFAERTQGPETKQAEHRNGTPPRHFDRNRLPSGDYYRPIGSD